MPIVAVAQTTFQSGEFFSFTRKVSVMDGQNKCM
jgi:hypothetical protein